MALTEEECRDDFGHRRRLKGCVEAWPECDSMAYSPQCCRWPKSCSATVYDPVYVNEEDLEPAFRISKEPQEPDVLALPIPGDEDGRTVGQFLGQCLQALWHEGEEFSGKRPLGDSGWEYEIYRAFAAAGLIEADVTTYDDTDWVDYDFGYGEQMVADKLIEEALTKLFKL